MLLRWVVGFCIALVGVAFADTGSKVCAPCHRTIYERYLRTPMANSSGVPAKAFPRESFARAEFRDEGSGVRYRIVNQDGSYTLTFDGGERRLDYFIGSGAVARSYVWTHGDFLFQAPVAYYSGERRWGLSPGFDRYKYAYLTRPVLPGCLQCHASGVQPRDGTQHGFQSPPFLEGGIGCERCHGAGERHLVAMRSGERRVPTEIVNPAKLTPERRDSVCSQCHLTGEYRITKAGRERAPYKPGDRLFDSVAVFVQANSTPGLKVTSHVEKLAQSACQKASGDRLWCGTCHDPHSLPASTERVAWYRDRCLGCHQQRDCERGSNCVSCHMPRSGVVDAQHVVYTDHSIPRRPVPAPPPPRDRALVAFRAGTTSDRDLGLAYAQLALSEKDSVYAQTATKLLMEARRENPSDVQVALYLAELYNKESQEEQAISLYREVLKADPAQVPALVALGALLMARGEFEEASRLWRDALARSPGLQLVRMNLAIAQAKNGDFASAESNLQKAVELNPGLQVARKLLRELQQR